MRFLKNVYNRDDQRKYTPVYVPQETYSFFINTEFPLTDPDFSNFSLNIYNGENTLIASNIGTLQKLVVDNVPDPAIDPYFIYCIFTFPEIPNGHYFISIVDTVTEIEKFRSTPILCEHEYLDRSVYIWYRNSVNYSGYRYEDLPDFYNMIRVPCSMADISFESERTQYRNASDKKLRNVVSYLEYGYKLEFYNIDNQAKRAVANILEHDNVIMNWRFITSKDQLTNEPRPFSEISKATCNVYVDQERFSDETLEAFPDIIIHTGTFLFNPSDIYQSNIF